MPRYCYWIITHLCFLAFHQLMIEFLPCGVVSARDVDRALTGTRYAGVYAKDHGE